jgi:opacity protein-like surface antigen
MKKILMTMVAVFAAMNMNAQVYVGGSVGFGSVKSGSHSSESTYKIVPEIGYNLNDQWAIGVGLGYQKGNCDFGNLDFAFNTQEIFTVSPYARYTFINSNLVNVFVDGGLGFASVKDGGSFFQAGVRPGIALKASDKISLVAHVGFVGFETFSPKNGDSSNAFGLNLDGNNILFGVYYNF